MKQQEVIITLKEYKELLLLHAEYQRVVGQYQILYNEYQRLLPKKKVLTKKNQIGFIKEEK